VDPYRRQAREAREARRRDLRWGCFSLPYWALVLAIGWMTGLVWGRGWASVLYYLVPVPSYVTALWLLERAGWLGANPGGSSGKPPPGPAG
jgi:hypothetical protein